MQERDHQGAGEGDSRIERPKSDVAHFLVEAADINLMEVHMGQMASKATLQEVKDFGNKMATEHQKAFDELVPLAAAKNVTIPTTVSDEGMKHHENLNDKTGYDFDREFMDKMVDGHETAIKKFQDAAENSEDAEIKAWAGKMLPNLAAHLEEAKLRKEKVKDMK